MEGENFQKNIFEQMAKEISLQLKPIISEMIKNEFRKIEVSKPTEKKFDLLTEKQLAGKLKKSKVTLWHWRKAGLISYKRIGKSIFYDFEKVKDEIKSFKLGEI